MRHFLPRSGQVVAKCAISSSDQVLTDGIICQSENFGEQIVPTRNVVLTPHQADFVEQLVASGRYQNASEVLREGLRLIERREEEDASRLIALRQAAQMGVADIEAGRFSVFETSAALGAHLDAVSAKAISGA
jgi:antitoxin ParD1/3/4